MKILISGSSGMVGTALMPALAKNRHEVWRLLRLKEKAGTDPRVLLWDPEAGTLDKAALEKESFDAVVHLGGINLASERWNEAFKKKAWDSRVESTKLLCRTLAALPKPPKVFACASAVGFYGDRKLEALDENSPAGSGFLAELCQAWEQASKPLADKGLRVIHLRFGMILSKDGGAVKRMILPFKLGLGGRVGSGKQMVSWIALPDLTAALVFLLEQEHSEGIYNCCSPNPVSNYNFTRALGRALGRLTLFPLPAFAAKIALGGMAEELLLASQIAAPKRLKEAGFKFGLPYIGEALTRILN
jgi:uncharacterized protein (TIGR01777 family)